MVKPEPIARRIIKRGMITWECNLDTGAIEKADMEESFYYVKGKKRVTRKVVVRKGCIYELAINGENATRKFEARILELVKAKN